MLKLTTIYTIRVVYKSGYTHDFDVTTFSIENGKFYRWDGGSDQNKPLQLGADDIAAIWQIGTRKRLTWP
jgi:hypothetical protein